MNKKLSIAIVWHMHQPLYKSTQENINLMPWVRLHCAKDYLDMLKMLDKFNDLKLNFNISCVLLDSIQEYIQEGIEDIHSKLTVTDIKKLTKEDKIFILNNFFDANYSNMILPNSYYAYLYNKRNKLGENIDTQAFSTQEYSDIMMWFNLVWTDPLWIENYPELKQMKEKQKNFSLEDRRQIICIHKEIMSKIISEYRNYQDKGLIEILTSPYYHPIMPILLDVNDAQNSTKHYPLPNIGTQLNVDGFEQVNKAKEKVSKLFGKSVQGIWPSEHCISQKTLECFAKCGFKWTISDEGILSNSIGKEFIRDNKGSIIDPYDLTQSYTYRFKDDNKNNYEIDVVFRDGFIPNLISFEYPLHNTQSALEDLQDRIKIVQSKLQNSPSNNHLLTIALDGENSWEGFVNDGKDFLYGLYEFIQQDDSLETVLISDYLVKNREKKLLKSVASGSWINRNFQLWICEPTKNLAWQYLNDVRKDLIELVNSNEYSNYQINCAWKEIYICEGSDWFWWYGEPNDSGQDLIFDYLFRQHLSNVYIILNKPIPAYLNRPLVSFVGRPNRNPKKTITPKINGKIDEINDLIWQNSGSIEIASKPIHEEKKLLNKIFFGCDEKNIYFRFDLNPYLKDEQGYFKSVYQLYIYFKCNNKNDLYFAPIRTVNKSDGLFPIFKSGANFELKLSFYQNEIFAPQMAAAQKYNLWVSKLLHNVEFAYEDTLELSIGFDELNINKGERLEFFFISAIFGKTEEVFPQDFMLSILRP